MTVPYLREIAIQSEHEQYKSSSSPTRSSYPLRVAYDAQAFLQPNGGTGKGAQLRNLLGPYSDAFVGFATKGHNYSENTIIQLGLSKYQLWQQLSLPRLLNQWGADVFLAPYNTAPLLLPKQTKLVLVLHDLILMERFGASNLRQRVDYEFRRFLIPRAVARANVVLTVSSYSKQQILHRFPSARVRVIPCSIPRSWFVGRDLRKLDERENCVLAVTGNVHHKNPHRALDGYAAFVAMSDRSTVPHLRMVGLSASAEEFRRRAAALQIADLVHIEPYLSEDQLQQLYRSSRAVLIPSYMEGFGIPVLESMASGTPVLASNATSLPEVGGPAGTYFDPYDSASIGASLKNVIDDPGKAQKMIEQGLSQAQKFHPDTVGPQVKAFWDALAAHGPNALSLVD
jgi:glycosyltransferase involved in cell wall biosynthesis